MVGVHHGGMQRVLRLAFKHIEIADRGPAFDTAGHCDGAGALKQCLGQACFAGGGRTDQGQGANVGGLHGAAVGWAWHGLSPHRAPLR